MLFIVNLGQLVMVVLWFPIDVIVFSCTSVMCQLHYIAASHSLFSFSGANLPSHQWCFKLFQCCVMIIDIWNSSPRMLSLFRLFLLMRFDRLTNLKFDENFVVKNQIIHKFLIYNVFLSFYFSPTNWMPILSSYSQIVLSWPVTQAWENKYIEINLRRISPITVASEQGQEGCPILYLLKKAS